MDEKQICKYIEDIYKLKKEISIMKTKHDNIRENIMSYMNKYSKDTITTGIYTCKKSSKQKETIPISIIKNKYEDIYNKYANISNYEQINISVKKVSKK